MAKNRESIIAIRVSEANKKKFQNFCKREGIPESQMGWVFIRRGMEDQNPARVRGAINQMLGMDVMELLKRYKYDNGFDDEI